MSSLYIPIPLDYYYYSTREAEEYYSCKEGFRVLAWINYLEELGLKRYYISEKYADSWCFITIDVFPDDRALYWDFCTQNALNRELYINSSFYTKNNDVVIHISPEEDIV